MSDITSTNPDPAAAPVFDSLTTFEGATEIVREAIERGVNAAAPFPIGDHGVVVVRPESSTVTVLDVRDHEDQPRLPDYIAEHRKFVGVRSLAKYVDRHNHTTATVAYVHDVYGRGAAMLTGDTVVAFVQFDDHPLSSSTFSAPGRKAHRADLVLRPTAAARRWGRALGASLDQESLLDLVQDGIGEIAEPDGATLRELVQNLHAIRGVEVRAVMRSGGTGSIQVTENVQLNAGTGNAVPFPEQLTVVFDPFAGIGQTITVKLRVKPAVKGTAVVFSLSAPELDDVLARVVGNLAAEIHEATGLDALWIP